MAFNRRRFGVDAPLLSVPPEVELSSVNSFTEVRAVIGKHCVQCHSNNNTHKVFRAPPAGFTLDSDDKIRAAAAVIISVS